MHKDLLLAKDCLLQNQYKITSVRDGEVIFHSDDSGIRGLLHALNNNSNLLIDSSIADKVVGKAAALLMVFGNISRVFTPLISKSALHTLLTNNIEVCFDKKTDFIKNRKGDDMCPMEKKCQAIDDPREAFLLLSGLIKGG